MSPRSNGAVHEPTRSGPATVAGKTVFAVSSSSPRRLANSNQLRGRIRRAPPRVMCRPRVDYRLPREQRITSRCVLSTARNTEGVGFLSTPRGSHPERVDHVLLEVAEVALLDDIAEEDVPSRAQAERR